MIKFKSFQEFDPKVIDALWDLGGFGIAVPEKYGGLGLNYTQLGRLTDAVGGNDLAIATMLGAHQSIGYKVSVIKQFC